ncbi:uncharacterized protein [Temnothorax longispinosus]|uniref:uncharacterized protein n=1 Tax=Temnothorax longispinosus TaxID=300112 RepID=UPI003A99A67D
MPPKHNFSKETDYRLIDLVELKPLLWDCTSHLYRQTDLKIAAWDEIAEQLGSDFTGAVVSSRFRNMKDTFARNLKAMKESKRSGAGTDNIYKPKWHLFERLMFLQKSCIQGDSQSNISPIQLETTAASDSESSQIIDEVNDNTSCTQNTLHIYYDEALQEFAIIPPEVNVGSTHLTSSDPNSSSVSVCSDFEPIAPLPEKSLSPQSLPRLASNFALSSITQSSQQQQNSVTVSNKRSSENQQQLFYKRGLKTKKQSSIMEEAVGALKQMAQPDPVLSLPQPEINDSAHTLALFLETRLRSLPPENRKKCEDEILKLLTQF